MNWITEWRALSDRIAGFTAAVSLYLQGLGVQNSDGYQARAKHLMPGGRAIFSGIRVFSSSHHSTLPRGAREALDRFIAADRGVFTDSNLDNLEAVLAMGTALAGFRAELDYQLADCQAVALKRTERAFQHLQRQLVADIEEQRRWCAALDEGGEPACERLGSVHLLQHGIWAFKVSDRGERTDLVFAETRTDLEEVASAADALVLTEWKVVRTREEVEQKIAQAKRQADLYAEGVLGGLELTGYRYLVMVSRDRLAMPPDHLVGGVTYRHRNIAVDPSTPSVAARGAS